MSAVPVHSSDYAHAKANKASAESPHVVSIVSPAVARAVVAELLLKPENLPKVMREALSKKDGDVTLVAALERMTVWADLSALVVSAMHEEERQRRRASLRYCVNCSKSVAMKSGNCAKSLACLERLVRRSLLIRNCLQSIKHGSGSARNSLTV